MVQWSQIILIFRGIVELNNMPGSDSSGFAGFEDEADNQFWRLMGASALTSIIAGGSPGMNLK